MEKTHIQWTDATVNFWTGCKKISDGCKYCYMYRDKDKYGQDPQKITRTTDKTFYQALEWEEGKKIFTCSWSDFFIEEADGWRKDAWEVIRRTPQHTWQILTKRPERIKQCLPENWGEGWDNVWIGTSIESQKYMDRVVILAGVPAKTRFISAEPLLDEIDFAKDKHLLDSFHWCIIGGESGNETGNYRYRECKKEWIEKIIIDLKETGVKVFVKQMGTFIAKNDKLTDRHGGDSNEWGTNLQIREFPAVAQLVGTSDKTVIMNDKVTYNGIELLKMKITSIPSLIDPIIPKYGLVALVGTSDIGKSTMLLQLCTDVVLNETFLSFPIKASHKSALYISTEDDKYAISYRLQRLEGCNEKKLENLRFIFETDNLLKKIDDELSKQKSDVVVLDTLSDLYPGDINQINKVRGFMEGFSSLAIKHSCLFIFNHHTGKNKEEKLPSKNNAIGSAGFEGKCRLVMELKQDYTDDNKKHLCLVKGNYLGSEHKSSSYELNFDQIHGFTHTGKRGDYNSLVRPKLFRPFANREIEQQIVLKMHTEGKSSRDIAKEMKGQGYKIGKTSVAEFIKASGPKSLAEKPDGHDSENLGKMLL